MAYSRWLTVFDDERGTLKLEFCRGLAFIHATFRKKVAAMRFARIIFPQLKHWLREVGHEMSYVCIPEGDAKLHRFEELFGFRDIRRINGHIIMGQRNGYSS